MLASIAFTLLAQLALASPIIVGSTTADVYPPTGTAVNTALFPGESEVGYAGPTVTGAEPFAYQTAAAQRFAKAQDSFAPLFLPVASDASAKQFQPIEHWGNLGPRYSLPADTFGLSEASPVAPDQCDITQVHLLFRHGSRYPSTGEAPSVWATKIAAAAENGTFVGTGDLSFMNDWTYKLGTEILNPFGRQQCYQLGVRSRMAYGSLLNNFTEAGALPVFRTGSQDRMVETMEAFAQGFFGRDSEEQYSLEIEIEATGVNATESPGGACTNYVKDYVSAATATAEFVAVAFAPTAERLQSCVTGGYTMTATDAYAMVNLCAYETISLGYSKFCSLFTEDDFKNFEYSFDLEFYYGFGPGAQTGASMGQGWVEEFVARVTQTPIAVYDSSTNSTLDGNLATFPLNQSIYADATHDAYVMTILTALNISSIDTYGTLPITSRPDDRSFQTSRLVPFNTNFVVQIMSCTNTSEPQMRFIINDAVIPLDKTYSGCGADKNGLCPVSTVITGIQARLDEIDFETACHGNWTAPAVSSLRDVNGLPIA